MASAQNIINKIIDDARADSDAIWQETQKKIAALKLDAEREAQRHVSRIKKAAAADAAKTRDKIFKESDQGSQNNELSMRREVIDEVFADVLSTLEKLSGIERELFLKRIALGEAKGGEALLPSLADRKLFEKGLLVDINKELEKIGKQPLALAPGDAPFSDGFLLISSNAEKDCSFPALVDSLREREEEAVEKLLFD